MAQPIHEPSMEDILASIKRIIAEDSEVAAPRPIRARREMASAPVTSITAPEPEPEIEKAPAEEPEIARAVEAAPEPEPLEREPIAPEPVAESAASADILELTSPIAEPYPAPPRKEPAPVMDTLMSDPAAQASRSAFAALTQLQVRAEAGQENTLEGLVGDLLRPMLREWLDRELPALVERMVSAEIGRISGRG